MLKVNENTDVIKYWINDCHANLRNCQALDQNPRTKHQDPNSNEPKSQTTYIFITWANIKDITSHTTLPTAGKQE